MSPTVKLVLVFVAGVVLANQVKGLPVVGPLIAKVSLT